MEKVELPVIKRIFDIIVSSIIFILFLPFLFLLLVWIAFEYLFFKSSRGSLFYCETRVSRGEPFKLCKFRIFKKSVLERVMKEKGFVHTKPLEQNSDNLTYYGRILKDIYLDELPQLINILKGEMTLVGPRPTNIKNSNKLKDKGIYTKELMKCGLTGVVQINKNKSSKSDIEMDMDYINFVSSNPGWKVFLYDIKIIFKTIKTIFEAKGL